MIYHFTLSESLCKKYIKVIDKNVSLNIEPSSFSQMKLFEIKLALDAIVSKISKVRYDKVISVR